MRVPVVVIIGRPNVGKSTLFNRLIGKREAIVDKVAGVTRDRNYGEVEWCGKVFNLIDTGGFVPDSDNVFEKAISEQIDAAIQESDAIIFLLDAYDGITPIDKMIANLLRRSNKPIYVVVNKVDDSTKEALSSDFYELGFDSIHTLSAQYGRKVGDFLDVLTKDFPLNAGIIEEKNQTPKFAVVGRPNVGKSSFVNAILGYDKHIVTEIPGTTRDAIDTLIRYYGREIYLIDTAGLRRRSKIVESIEFFSVLRTLKALDRCNVSIVLIDATQGLEKQDLRIISESVKRKRGIIIAVNKWDLIEKDDKTAARFESAIREQLGEYYYIPIIFISALNRQRIYKVIEIALQILEEWRKKISTSAINEFIEKNFRNVSFPSTSTGKEIKIKYGVQLKTAPPVFAFFTNEPKHIPDHSKRFIEKKFREEFNFLGVPLTFIFKKK